MTKQPRIAFVYDRVNKWGGAERVLLALHELWPGAPLYTAVYDPKRAPWAKVFDIRTSFLQHFPFAKTHHELYPWLTQMAFELFSFDEYDVVISVASAEAKAIITKPHTLHICYCLTPTRYLWSGYDDYQRSPGFGWTNDVVKYTHKTTAPKLRSWDLVASSRPDYYIAISERVKERIKRYYKRTVESVIYPSVDTRAFSIQHSAFRMNRQKGYFLVVSRLVGYKRLDMIITACNSLKLPLVVIGDGHGRGELMRIAGPTIQFVTKHLTDEELLAYYRNCRAFIAAADEDFGMAAAEAQAAGKPVIAFADSGTSEIVRDGKTGILYTPQRVEAIIGALKRSRAMHMSSDECKKNSIRFSSKRFHKQMSETVGQLYRVYNR